MWRVVKALLQVPRLHELHERNLLVRMLADGWGGPLPVQEHPRPIEHLFSLVEACYTRPYGLESLVDMLERLEPGSAYVVAVRNAVEPMIPLEIWPSTERDNLFVLLDGVALPNFTELYKAAGGQSAPELRPRSTFRDAFESLEMLTGGPDGVPRALVFVELLANLVRTDLALSLRRWTERQAALIGIADELQKARQRPPLAGGSAAIPSGPAPRTPAYVVLQIRPEGVDGGTFRLSRWRQLDASGDWSPDRDPDYLGDLASVQNKVAELMENLEADWAAYQPAIFVEFVLPHELLNLDVDQWDWDTDPRLSEPIGCHFPVVVRSLDRMSTRKYHRSWFQRWQQLKQQLSNFGAIAPDSGYWSTSGNAESLRAISAAFEQQPALIALVPSAPPQAGAEGTDEVVAGFRQGVPVMMWHRENCQSQGFADAVREILHGDDPRDVLERVRVLRLSGYAAGGDLPHVGTKLTLLWDDPDRIVTPDQPAPPARMASAS